MASTPTSTPPLSDTGRTPALVGRYRVLRRLAAGGMAEVFLTRMEGPLGFQKIAVLKRVLPHLASSETFTSMFLDEARLAAMLDHPNIATVYDFGLDGTYHYFTMEFVHGPNVREILARSARGARLSLGAQLYLLSSVAAGLHYAHERRGPGGEPLAIVHRDVSPANVMVSWEGKVKLVDFGIAKASQREVETRSDVLKGKVNYMSPEQCLFRPLDRRSDVFSLGIVAYELTTGSRLFYGDSDFEVMKNIVEDPIPSPARLVKDYPAELAGVIEKALGRDPEARYQTAEAMQIAIERFALDQRIHMSATELARSLREVFGDEAEQPTAIDFGPDPDLDLATTLIATEGTPEPTAATVALHPAEPPAASVAGALESPPVDRVEVARPERLPRARILLVAGTAVAVLALAAIIFKMASPSKHPAPAHTVSATAPPAVARAAPPAAVEPPSPTVTITVAVEPEGATLTVDGAPVTGQAIALLQHSGRHELVVRAAGFRTNRRQLDSDQDSRIEIALERIKSEHRRPRQPHSSGKPLFEKEW